MAQTSVEWLVSHLNKQEWFTFKQKEYIEQAKKMHEAEIKKAYDKVSMLTAQEYYNETFKK